MNRVQGDYFEKLLYKIFVTIDGQTSVKELAEIIGIDNEYVKLELHWYIFILDWSKTQFLYFVAWALSRSVQVDSKIKHFIQVGKAVCLQVRGLVNFLVKSNFCFLVWVHQLLKSHWHKVLPICLLLSVSF